MVVVGTGRVVVVGVAALVGSRECCWVCEASVSRAVFVCVEGRPQLGEGSALGEAGICFM